MNATTHQVRFEVVRGEELVDVIVTGEVDPMSAHVTGARTADGAAVELSEEESRTAEDLLIEADDDAQGSWADFHAAMAEDEAMARADMECIRGY